MRFVNSGIELNLVKLRMNLNFISIKIKIYCYNYKKDFLMFRITVCQNVLH